MKRLAIAIFCLTLGSTALANPQQQRSISLTSEMTSTLDKAASLQLTEKDKSLAKQWMLEETDWIKYKEIMSGPRGIWSPGLDPLTALGVSETDPKERQRYAEIWTKVETRRAELEFAFEVERQRVGKRIHGDQLAVNNTSWIKEWEQKHSEIRKQVAVFMDASCQSRCKDIFNDVRASVGDSARLDVFFAPNTSSEEVGQWATYMKLDPAEVRENKVTLNFDEGKAASMNVDISEFPQVRVVDLKTGEVSETFK